MSTDLSPQFDAAIQLAKSGQTGQALTQLRRLLIQQPDNISGLMWLSWLTPDPHEGIAALEKVISLNPDPSVVQRAQQGLTSLRTKANTPIETAAPIPVISAPVTVTPVTATVTHI
jgi:predicted Zn-dependent protease